MKDLSSFALLYTLINSFIIFAAFRQSLERVFWAHLLVIAPWQHSSFQRNAVGWRAFGNISSDLIDLRIEPQTSRSRNERIAAQLTARSLAEMELELVLVLYCAV